MGRASETRRSGHGWSPPAVGQAPIRRSCAGSRFGVTAGSSPGFELLAQDVRMPCVACRLVDHVHVDLT
jgi:hypothetical protein